MNQLNINLYDDQFDDEYMDYQKEIIPLVPRAKLNSAEEALKYLLSEFYNSANEINEKGITETFAYLCDCLNVSDELLRGDSSLCVVHWKKARPRSEFFDFSANLVRQQYNTKGK